MDLSIVIPVYNSSATLNGVVTRLLDVLNKTGMRFELVFVNDGSRDDSWRLLCEMQEAHPGQITAIDLTRNFGQHNALMCGFRHAAGQWIITMDDDLQNPPEEIPKLLAAVEANRLDVVYGSSENKEHASWRNIGTWLMRRFYRLVFRCAAPVTSFRIIRRELLVAILSYKLNYTYIDGLLAWNTQRIGHVEVEHHPRRTGRSGYSLAKLVRLALDLLTNFSLVPLQVASIFGLVVALCGFVTGLFYLVEYFRAGISIPGYASTIVAILILGGTQLVALGMIGEYVGRMHLNVNLKPQYTERQVKTRQPAGEK